MVSSINSNNAALVAQANIATASANASASIARLSSGNRIVKASDDVSGLAIGTSLATQVTALNAALGNANQGSSLLQVANGALSQINDILQRQSAIASEAGSGTLTDTDRSFLNQEFQALTSQIDQIASSTNFNGVNLLGGGLGTSTTLADTGTAAAKYTPTTVTQSAVSTFAVSTSPIQAFNIQSGASLAGTGAAGDLDITDSTGTLLTTGYTNVNSALQGQFSSFVYSNVVFGATTAGSATLTATINGVAFSGAVQGTATSAILKNGNTYIKVGLTAATDTFTDADATQLSQTTLGAAFANTVLQKTQTVSGINFAGTRLAGAIGSVNYGIASARLNSSNASISNFAYVSNTGAANTNVLSVQVNGETFTATAVKDNLGAGTLDFQSQDGQSLVVDLTGITTALTNIRTSSTDQTSLINALNQGFSKAGSGLNFALGSGANSNVNVSLASASSANLFGGQTLDVSTSADAAAASTAINNAINTVSGLTSTVGALESRFNFATANLQTSVQNEDAARGDLLDTDVSSESTSFASSQVELQAGIAVLAQANQLPQNLLKLIQ